MNILVWCGQTAISPPLYLLVGNIKRIIKHMLHHTHIHSHTHTLTHTHTHNTKHTTHTHTHTHKHTTHTYTHTDQDMPLSCNFLYWKDYRHNQLQILVESGLCKYVFEYVNLRHKSLYSQTMMSTVSSHH